MSESASARPRSSLPVRRHAWDRALSLSEVNNEMRSAFGFGSFQITAPGLPAKPMVALRYAELGPVMIIDAIQEADVWVDLGERRSCYYLAIPCSGRMISRYLGTDIELTRGKPLLYQARGSAITRAGAGSRLVGVKFSVHHVHQTLESQLGEQITRPIAFAPVFDQAARHGIDWIGMALELNEKLRHEDTLLLNPLVALPYVESLTQGLLLASDHPYRRMLDRQVSGHVRPSAVRRVTDLMETEPGRPLTVAALAAEASISVRALQEGFKREYGMTPMAYLRGVRLRRTRADLRTADPSVTTVASIAHRWGFTNPSRFAARYTAAFGEPPSATLRGRG